MSGPATDGCATMWAYIGIAALSWGLAAPVVCVLIGRALAYCERRDESRRLGRSELPDGQGRAVTLPFRRTPNLG